MMGRFIKDRRGEGMLWAFFTIVVLIVVAMLCYTLYTTTAQVRSVETELQRCASIVIDASTTNPRLRDVLIDLQEGKIQTLVKQNMRENGWYESGGCWQKDVKGSPKYRLKDFTVSVDDTGKRLTVSADVQIPLFKSMGSITNMTFPVTIYSKILYIGN